MPNPDGDAAQRAKRERRLERQRQEAAARHRSNRRKRLRKVALAATAVVGVAVAGYFLVRPDPEMDGVTRLRSAGRDHVTGARYETATPTSGDHNPSAPGCGSTSELPLDLAVHALEHGAIVVWHRPDIDPDLRADAASLLREWGSHWILAPSDDIEFSFVATAWNRRLALDEPGEQMREFVDTYRRRGPERVDCPA